MAGKISKSMGRGRPVSKISRNRGMNAPHSRCRAATGLTTVEMKLA